jgi:hypothetical protein
VTDEVIWHEGYPPRLGQPGLTKRWLSRRTVEKRAPCPFHEQWEAVWRWRWTDLPPEYRAGWPWLQQMVAHTERGCQVVYVISPDGIHLRPDLSTGSERTTMDLPEPPRPGLRLLPPPRPDLRAPPPPPPSRSRKDHSARNWTIAIGVIFGLIVAGAIAKNSEDNSGTDTTTDSGIDQGIATNDASGDVSVGDCETEFGLLTCDVTIVNSSDDRSDYLIDATVEDSSGAKVGIANTYVTGVEGGQTAKAELTGTFSGEGTNLSVRLTEVQRTAS